MIFFRDRQSKKALVELIDSLKTTTFPQTDLDAAAEYVEHYEFGVGFEHLCTQLYEHNTQISPAIYSENRSARRIIENARNILDFPKRFD